MDFWVVKAPEYACCSLKSQLVFGEENSTWSYLIKHSQIIVSLILLIFGPSGTDYLHLVPGETFHVCYYVWFKAVDHT